MLIPQFSVRSLLLITSLVACACLVASLAVRGHHWALGVTIGIVTAVLAIAIQAVVFFLVWLVSLLGRIRIGRPNQKAMSST